MGVRWADCKAESSYLLLICFPCSPLAGSPTAAEPTSVCSVSGGSGPAPALVEDPAVCMGASAVRHLGWCVHVLHDKHFWSCPLLEDWLAGGE